MLMPNIPINILVSLNNLESSRTWGIISCIIAPWIIAIPLQTGTWINPFRNWTALLFVSTTNFVVPVLVYLASRNEKRVLSESQKQVLLLVFPYELNGRSDDELLVEDDVREAGGFMENKQKGALFVALGAGGVSIVTVLVTIVLYIKGF